MPATDVIPFLEDDGSVPLRDWLATLPIVDQARCIRRLDLLGELGHELRRPHAEYLEGTDLYELRIRVKSINYRVLYFFHGRLAAVVSHGFAKAGKIPPGEIALATDRMDRFKADPERHTFRGDG